MLSWWEPAFGQEEADAVAAVVASGYVNEGKKTKEFTDAVQAALGVKHVLATCSGTVALYLAMKASGVSAGDEVIVPDLTFIATANAAAMCCARPVPVDIRLTDLNIDPAAVEKAITGKTKAIVAVHINGRCADIPALQRLADQHGLALIEDAAQSLGSFHDGKALGTLAEFGCVSLAPTKIITSGQGGLVMTNRDDLKDRIVRLKDHGRLSRAWNYHPEIGFNFKYSDIYAAIALVQFAQLDGRIGNVKHQYMKYAEGLSAIPQITFIETALETGTVPLWVDALVEDAQNLIDFLKTRQIDCRPFWPAIHTQDPYRTSAPLPNSAIAAQRGVWFPSGAGKSDADIDRVINEVKDFYDH